MIDIRRILCPVDFSDCSRRALDHAVAIAKWYESTLTLLHVCAPVPISAYATVAPMMPPTLVSGQNQNEVLEALKRFPTTADGTGVPLEFALGEGDAAGEIVSTAAAGTSDLIVMGTHGRSGFERLMLGSVTEKVLRKAGSPVLTVPPRAADVASPPPATFKRILCALDFSDCSMRALDYAMSLAQESNSTLTVLHVIEPLPAAAIDGHEVAAGDYTITDYLAAAEEEGRAHLARTIPPRVREFCQVETVQCVGTPYREILRVAEEEASDAIVIGVHGRGAVDLFFFGSTAQQVVRQAACPVLTMRT
ncbi:MAG TPA: universal stress protein [Vicinamibacterales bacterium]|jgi:nucleotide-binding universal stress UspA family protein